MAQLYFDCSSADRVLLDRRGYPIDDLTEARDYAAQIVMRLISAPGQEDWRDWVLHISDEDGEEVLEIPFLSVVGKPH